jgi:flagellar motility protein MotE (MotC chaperone)
MEIHRTKFSGNENLSGNKFCTSHKMGAEDSKPIIESGVPKVEEKKEIPSAPKVEELQKKKKVKPVKKESSDEDDEPRKPPPVVVKKTVRRLIKEKDEDELLEDLESVEFRRAALLKALKKKAVPAAAPASTPVVVTVPSPAAS